MPRNSQPDPAPGAIPSVKRSDPIVLAHGGGGQLTDELVAQSILPRLANPVLSELLDAALLPLPLDAKGESLSPPPGGRGKTALTIDSYVVQPLFFPGGDIGRLAICGTVNDLAVMGAKPAGIALSLILEEGLERADLERVLDSIAAAAAEAQVRVVTGDTKTVSRGRGDGMYITTAGVGWMCGDRCLHPQQVQPGDVLIVNGPIAEHGLAVMLAREMPEVQTAVRSDVAPLNGLIADLLAAVAGVAFLRDATRGGLAGVAVDLAQRCNARVVLEETQIPLRPEARQAADMLGLDPLEVANEGKVVIVVRNAEAQAALTALRRHPLGREAQIIGKVESAEGDPPRCELHTRIGGRRIVQKPYGEQLPRIC